MSHRGTAHIYGLHLFVVEETNGVSLVDTVPQELIVVVEGQASWHLIYDLPRRQG